jgi:hypothetical protein
MADIYFPSINPTYFLKARKENQTEDQFWNWVSQLPDDWIEDFVKNGLLPFLNRYGYTVAYTLKEIVAYCKRWAFAHVQVTSNKTKLLEISFLQTRNTGGPEEYDWFTYTIPSDDWFSLAEDWCELQFFDETDAGESQKLDLQEFAWNILYLEGSKSHQEFLYFIESDSYDQDDDIIAQPLQAEDQGAYGGDRRTL